MPYERVTDNSFFDFFVAVNLQRIYLPPLPEAVSSLVKLKNQFDRFDKYFVNLMTTNSVRVTLRSIKPPTSSGKPDSEPSTLSLLPNPSKSNNQPPSPNRRCSQLDIYEARSINHFWASSVFPALAALEEINKLPLVCHIP